MKRLSYIKIFSVNKGYILECSVAKLYLLIIYIMKDHHKLLETKILIKKMEFYYKTD